MSKSTVYSAIVKANQYANEEVFGKTHLTAKREKKIRSHVYPKRFDPYDWEGTIAELNWRFETINILLTEIEQFHTDNRLLTEVIESSTSDREERLFKRLRHSQYVLRNLRGILQEIEIAADYALDYDPKTIEGKIIESLRNKARAILKKYPNE